MAQKNQGDFWERVEKKGSAFQAGFFVGLALAMLGYLTNLTYALMSYGGFSLFSSIPLALVTAALLFTGIGPVISGFAIAAMSDGRISWMAAAIAPYLSAAVWALIGYILAEGLGAIFKLLSGLFRQSAATDVSPK